MRYEESYRQAMEKISASESWKADTLQKMAQQPRRTVSLSVVKRAALPVAAAVAVISAALLLPQSNSLSTGGAQPAEQSLQSAAPAPAQQTAPQQDAAAQPRLAMAFSAQLPTLEFSAQELEEVSSEQLPEAVELSQPEQLPVWQQESDEFVLLGEYPLLPAQEAALAVQISDYTAAELVYVQSMGYLQPCYQFVLKTQNSPVYAAAICGEYY